MMNHSLLLKSGAASLEFQGGTKNKCELTQN